MPRLAYLLWRDADLPRELHVCHHCDNPLCFNPDHLFAGTPKENSVDAAQKGRMARGERNRGGGKLTEQAIHNIRHALASGQTGRSQATRYGVSEAMISRIKLGKAWNWLAEK